MSSKKAMTCPCCKVEMSVREDGWGQCPTTACDFVGLVAPELMSMWGNQWTPGTVEVPVDLIKRIKAQLYESPVGFNASTALCALFSHLPDSKEDHIAELRLALLESEHGRKEAPSDSPFPARYDARIAALKFAIKKLEEG